MQNNDTFILFFALLAILCQAFVCGSLVLGLVATVSSGARTSLRSVNESLRPLAPAFTFVVALVTMLGSLYMSEIKDFEPCHLCWIQRGLLYPQVIWALLLWIKPKWTWLRIIAMLMLAGDVGVSTYHYLLEWNPGWETSVCSLKNPCSLVWFREFGYLTLPLMALTSALTQLILHVISTTGVSTTGISSTGIWHPKKFLFCLPVLSIIVFLMFRIVL